jgi:hypothetical protein
MVTVLDPRISYEGVCADYENDSELSEYLETAKAALHQHYKENYLHLANSSSPTSTPTAEAEGVSELKKKSFTDRYKGRDQVNIDELVQYFQLVPEDFDTCDPIEWWFARRHQFPSLHRFALDILSIPGMFPPVSNSRI